MTIAKLFLLAKGLLARFEPPKRGDAAMVVFFCDQQDYINALFGMVTQCLG